MPNFTICCSKTIHIKQYWILLSICQGVLCHLAFCFHLSCHLMQMKELRYHSNYSTHCNDSTRFLYPFWHTNIIMYVITKYQPVYSITVLGSNLAFSTLTFAWSKKVVLKTEAFKHLVGHHDFRLAALSNSRSWELFSTHGSDHYKCMESRISWWILALRKYVFSYYT